MAFFFSSLRRFYARGIVAYRLSGAELDSAMRTQPESEACEVYCISGNERPGRRAAQVSGACACAHRTARKKEILAHLEAIVCLFMSYWDPWCLIHAAVIRIYVVVA